MAGENLLARGSRPISFDAYELYNLSRTICKICSGQQRLTATALIQFDVWFAEKIWFGQNSQERYEMPQFFRISCFALVSLLSMATILPTVEAGEFRAAAAKADITPTDLVLLWGYGDRSGPAIGTHDPLYAKILVLDDGSTRLAWVTLDLGRPFGVESMNVVRNRIQKSAGVTHVCFSASHTHSGPSHRRHQRFRLLSTRVTASFATTASNC